MGKPRSKKKNTNRYYGQDIYKKYTFANYEIGKDKRKCCVKFPKTIYRQRVSMARKYLRLNYATSRIIRKSAKCITKISAKEWYNEVERQKSLPFNKRYRYYSLHRQRMSRKARDPLELRENKKAYDIQEPDTIPTLLADRENIFENIDKDRTDEWQCINWVKPMQSDYVTVEVNEIISNLRMVGLNWNGSLTVTPLTVIFLESLRAAVFSQDWRKVAKSMEGIFIESVTRNHTRHQIVWNAGFHSVLRFTMNDKEKVKEFARIFKASFRPKVYGRRLGNEVGIWLAQEGFFNESILFLDEMDITPANGGYYHQPKYRLPFNPKRDLIDLMTNLIKGVFLYSLWKRDCANASEGLYRGSAEDLRRSGENALSTFEGLLELAQDCETDVTTFLEPLIELTLLYRSPARANILFQEFVIRHYGNAFVEDAYYQFLREHFPESESEIKNCKKLREKFRFKPVDHGSNTYRAVAAYRKQRNTEMPQKVYLKKIPNPNFSW